MRRIALLVGLFTAIAGGAAAFAAPGSAPTAPAPDPYLGTWALMIDGTYAGPLATVDGCNLAAPVVAGQPGPDAGAAKHIGNVAPAPCSVEFGVGMTPGFYKWLSSSLSGTERHDLQIVRVDLKAPYEFELTHGAFASLTLPKIDRASVSPAFLKLTLTAERVRRLPAPLPPKEAMAPARGFTPGTLDVQLKGARLDVASAGPWTVQRSQETDRIGDERDFTTIPGRLEVGELPLRVPEARAATILDPWLQSFMVGGQSGDADELPVLIALAGDGKAGRVELALDHAGLAEGDLAARADGARRYSLYAERVAISAR